MTKLIRLDFAIHKGIIKEGDYINPISCFQNDSMKVVLERKQTGWDKDQTFYRENLKWMFLKDSEGIPSLFSTATIFQLHLKGLWGYLYTDETLDKVSSIYSNSDINMFATCLKLRDVNLLRKSIMYKESLKHNSKRIWLSDSRYKKKTALLMGRFGIRCLERFSIKERDFSRPPVLVGPHNLYRIDRSYGQGFCGICNVISLKDTHILVDIESKSREGKWKLIPEIKKN